MISLGPSGFGQAPKALDASASNTKIGFLKEDRQVSFRTTTNCTLVRAWRIVDHQGEDLIHPWCDTLKEAKQRAKDCGIQLQATFG